MQILSFVRKALILFCLVACTAPTPVASVTPATTETQAPTVTVQPSATTLASTSTPVPTVTLPPTPAPTATEIPLPANYTFVFQGQTPEREAMYRESITAGYRWLYQQGITDTGPFTLFAYDDEQQGLAAAVEFFQMPEWWVKQRVNFGTTHFGTHGPGFMWHWTGGSEFRPEFCFTYCDADEYLQSVLLNLAGLDRTAVVNDYFPAWLIQGSEKYLGARLCDYYDPGCFANLRAAWTTEARIHPATLNGRLADAEQYGTLLASEGVIGSHALEYLAINYGGDKKLFEFHIAFKNRQPEETWREVFEEIYGIPVEQFYSDFDSYRLKRFPDIYTAGRVVGRVDHAENGPFGSVWVFACPEAPSYDCVPTQAIRYYHSSTDSYESVWTFVDYIPMKFGETYDVIVSFAGDARPESIFGYYTEAGGFTTDPTEATVLHVGSSETIDIGTLELPSDYLPPTVTPTVGTTP